MRQQGESGHRYAFWRRRIAGMRDGSGLQVRQAGEIRSARVESLRGLAALGVLGAHVLVVSYGARLVRVETDPLLRFKYFAGRDGLLLFFALSGYLLYLPFARRDFASGPKVDLRYFALNRVLRIVPLYLVAVWLLLIVQEHGGTLYQWILLSTFTSSFDLASTEHVLRAGWSLVVEAQFYLALPLLAWTMGRVGAGSKRRALLVLAVPTAISVYLRGRQIYWGPAGPAEPANLTDTFLFFVPGMALALLRVHWDHHRPRLPGLTDRSAVWICAALVCLYATGWSLSPPYELFAGAFAFLLIGACVLPLRGGYLLRALEWRPLAGLGVISYSAYIWHGPLLLWLADVFPYASDSRALFAVALPLVLVTATASYFLVERPFLRLRRRWVSRDARVDRPAATKVEAPAPVSAG